MTVKIIKKCDNVTWYRLDKNAQRARYAVIQHNWLVDSAEFPLIYLHDIILSLVSTVYVQSVHEEYLSPTSFTNE